MPNLRSFILEEIRTLRAHVLGYERLQRSAEDKYDVESSNYYAGMARAYELTAQDLEGILDDA